jgi:hypothetical protein
MESSESSMSAVGARQRSQVSFLREVAACAGVSGPPQKVRAEAHHGALKCITCAADPEERCRRGEARRARPEAAAGGEVASARAGASPRHLSAHARGPRWSEAGPRVAGRAASCRRGEAQCALPEAPSSGESASARRGRYSTTPEALARSTAESEASTRIAGPKARCRRGEARRRPVSVGCPRV